MAFFFTTSVLQISSIFTSRIMYMTNIHIYRYYLLLSFQALWQRRRRFFPFRIWIVQSCRARFFHWVWLPAVWDSGEQSQTLLNKSQILTSFVVWIPTKLWVCGPYNLSTSAAKSCCKEIWNGHLLTAWYIILKCQPTGLTELKNGAQIIISNLKI